MGRKRDFAVGERVRLSALGLERSPRSKGYFGCVVGRARGGAYQVLFDGLKAPTLLHEGYLESDDVAAPDGVNS